MKIGDILNFILVTIVTILLNS